MRLFRRRSVAPGASASDMATHVVVHSGGGQLTAIGTVIALVFSAYSLWETSLKQAKLDVYVTGVVTYTRDATDDYLAPAGGFEVFAVPVTIANSGARDAAVLSLQLDAKNSEDRSDRPLRRHVHRRRHILRHPPRGRGAKGAILRAGSRGALGLDGHNPFLSCELQQRKSARASGRASTENNGPPRQAWQPRGAGEKAARKK